MRAIQHEKAVDPCIRKDIRMNITIRTELVSDYRIVEEVTRDAFSYPGRIEKGGIGSPYEHWVVHELRNRDGIKELSLVAEVNNQIVGHIICSNAHVQVENQVQIPVLNFGPLSVAQNCQSLGIGKALMHAMIEKAKALNYGAILFFGRPKYYPQFGFLEAASFGIADCNGCNYPAFMAIELQDGYLANANGGRFYESDIYNDEKNREAVKLFDEKFVNQK